MEEIKTVMGDTGKSIALPEEGKVLINETPKRERTADIFMIQLIAAAALAIIFFLVNIYDSSVTRVYAKKFCELSQSEAPQLITRTVTRLTAYLP